MSLLHIITFIFLVDGPSAAVLERPQVEINCAVSSRTVFIATALNACSHYIIYIHICIY